MKHSANIEKVILNSVRTSIKSSVKYQDQHHLAERVVGQKQ